MESSTPREVISQNLKTHLKIVSLDLHRARYHYLAGEYLTFGEDIGRVLRAVTQ